VNSPDTKPGRIDLRHIPIDLIHPNAWNPQAQDEITFQRLVDEIRDVGFIDPLEVVPMDDGTYRIIGGEHRWQAAKIVGLDELPCAVLSDAKWQDEDLCFPAGTRIETPQGGVSIEVVEPGTEVFAADGTVTRSVGLIAREYEGEMVAIYAEGQIQPLVATSDHPVFVRRGGEIIIVRATDIQDSDALVAPTLPCLLDGSLQGNLSEKAPYASPSVRSHALDDAQGDCSVRGCANSDVYAHGICRRCYGRWYYRSKISKRENFPDIASGTLLYNGVAREVCSIESCANLVHGDKLCGKHYGARRRLGSEWERLHRERFPGVPDTEITPDVAWAIGFMVAEAHAGEADVSVVQVGARHRLERLQRFWERQGARTTIYDRESHSEFVAFGIAASEWLSSTIGHRCAEKRFPLQILFHKNMEIRKQALRGYCEGDGHNIPKDTTKENFHESWCAATTSEELANQLGWLLYSLGYSYGVGHKSPEGNRNRVWSLSWTASIPEQRGPATQRASGHTWWKRVKHVERWNDHLTVYNLQTEPAGTFVANGVAVHNCKFVTVRLNVLKGKMDPEKFAKLYGEMAEKYGAEALQQLMGYADTKGFQKIVGDVKRGLKKSLPKELQDEFDEKAKEAKTIEDLSNILQHLFAKHGDTVNLSFMVFSFGKQEHVYCQMNRNTKKALDKVLAYCKHTNEDINDFLGPIIEEAGKQALSALDKSKVAAAKVSLDS